MRLATTAAERSEDPYHKVGCCLLRADHTIAALGFNGAPSGVDIDWSDRDARRVWVIHAEANALRYVTPGEVTLMASTMMPCTQCVLLAASYGIKVITYRDELDPAVYDTEETLKIARACGISIIHEDGSLL
jgi:dCMP deaminase